MEIVAKPNKYELGEMLLEIGSLLMVSGANTERVKVTISRIASAFDCDSDLMITNHALMITLTYKDNIKTFTSVKWVPNMHLNFNLISDISTMSWKIVEEKWSVERINNEMKLLNRKPLYSRGLVLFLVALAGASFCRLFGGDFIEMGLCFLGTLLGLFVRQETLVFTWLGAVLGGLGGSIFLQTVRWQLYRDGSLFFRYLFGALCKTGNHEAQIQFLSVHLFCGLNLFFLGGTLFVFESRQRFYTCFGDFGIVFNSGSAYD